MKIYLLAIFMVCYQFTTSRDIISVFPTENLAHAATNYNKHSNKENIKNIAEKLVKNPIITEEVVKKRTVAGAKVYAFSNPENGVLTINGLTSELTYDLHVQIFDFRGTKIESRALSVSVNTIDLANYPCGVYFVKYSNTAIPTQYIVKGWGGNLPI